MHILLAPRSLGAHLLMVLAVLVTTLLGLWQLDSWQAGREADARDLSQAAPLQLTEVMGGDDPYPGQYVGQPIELSGSWLPEGTVYVADRYLDGEKGYWVVTPVLIGDSAIPVVRGWSTKASSQEPSGEVEVRGWLQPSEGTNPDDPDPSDDVIPEMRIASIVQHVDTDLYSAFVVAKNVTGPGGQTASPGDDEAAATAGLSPVTPESVPSVSTTSHLKNLLYAVQWWLFGAFAIYIWARWCRDQLELVHQSTASPEEVPSST